MDAADASLEGDRQIVITRVYDAPRALVWRAFTTPAHLAQWWGPQGFATITDRMELKAGGQWRFVMRGPDGRDYPNLITYIEVVEPERLVFRHGSSQDEGPFSFHQAITLSEEGPARTRVTMRSTFPSAHARDFVIREVNAVEGGRQTLGRLAGLLEAMQGSADATAGSAPAPDPATFVATRVVHAPLDRVWRAWTERESLQRWFGPAGVTMPTCTLDLRPGGIFHYAMQPPVGDTFWGLWVFREIVPRARLVFDSSFADAQGGAVRHPMAPTWPLRMLTEVTFAEHAGIGHGTTVVVRSTPLDASDDERRAFQAGHDSMRQGWSGTFDRLAAHLAESPAG